MFPCDQIRIEKIHKSRHSFNWIELYSFHDRNFKIISIRIQIWIFKTWSMKIWLIVTGFWHNTMKIVANEEERKIFIGKIDFYWKSSVYLPEKRSNWRKSHFSLLNQIHSSRRVSMPMQNRRKTELRDKRFTFYRNDGIRLVLVSVWKPIEASI